MSVTFSMWQEVQLSPGIWTDISSDVRTVEGVRLKYGIEGNRPQDCTASTGECQYSLQNDAKNSGSVLGYYSPLHASKRVGWTFGLPIQVAFAHGSDAAISITSITRSSQVATVTTGSAHGRATGDHMKIAGATQAEYNGTWKITVTGASTFTYTVAGSPTTPAGGTKTARRAYVKHRGKIRVIDPDAGIYGPRQARVTSYDGIRDLAETDLRQVDLLLNATESACISAVLDALPAESRPVYRDIDTGVDVFPFAFDDLGSGVKALGVLHDLALSSAGIVFIKGDGTFTFESRATRAQAASAFTFTNVMHGLTVPSDLDNVYNLARVTIHKRTVSEFSNEVIYDLPEGTSLAIGPGATIEVWTDYSDPNDRQTPVGGAEVVTGLVGGTHYAASNAPDGSGTDLTGSITADVDPFASTAKWTLTNGSGDAAFVHLLKVIGKALRDLGPQSFEAMSVQPYGTRPLNLDLRYQGDSSAAQSFATYLEAQYNDLDNQIGQIEIIGNYSSDLLRQALEREPGDVITVTETLTGLSSVEAVIHSVEIEVIAGPVLICRFGLAPPPAFQGAAVWLAGIAGKSEAGTTTVPGF